MTNNTHMKAQLCISLSYHNQVISYEQTTAHHLRGPSWHGGGYAMSEEVQEVQEIQ
jgi:hypothetical protein